MKIKKRKNSIIFQVLFQRYIIQYKEMDAANHSNFRKERIQNKAKIYKIFVILAQELQ